jgi:sulfhydrogenase subunit beta (sulfur reductase)
MGKQKAVSASAVVLERADLQSLIDRLAARGYTVVGPTVRDRAVVHEAITSAGELAAGWTDEQRPGAYRLTQSGDGAVFGFAAGPQSWKRFFLPPRLRLFRARRNGLEFDVVEGGPEVPRLALLGVRACDLAAILVQDRTFLNSGRPDPHYAARRAAALIVAVQCTRPGGTCFCVSMGTGPRAVSGFDIALTEIAAAKGPAFVVQTGSAAGAEIVAELPCRSAVDGETAAAEAATTAAAERMGRTLPLEGLKEELHARQRSATASHRGCSRFAYSS